MGHILSVIKENNIDIIHKTFETDCQLTIGIRLSEEAEKLIDIKAGILNITKEEASLIDEIPFCIIQKC